MKPHLFDNRIKTAGFTLLPVILMMSLIAAIAFLLNRDNGMNAEMVLDQNDMERARYAAEAGLQAANAKIQSLNCAGGYPISSSPVTDSNFGGASYSAYATSASGNTTSLVSTGTYNGTSITLARNNIYAYQSTAKTYTLQPNGADGMDTYIDSANATNYGTAASLQLGSTRNMLFKFNLSAFPAGSRPISARFSIFQNGALLSSTSFYRMTNDWTEGTGASSPADGATWSTRNGSVAWTTPGGDYHPAGLNSSNVINAIGSWAEFDATDIVAAWLSGQYPNYGVMVKSNSFNSPSFVSSDNFTSTNRPKIVFNYLLPCGATGPADLPPVTSQTLSPTADSFNDSGAVQSNNGSANTLKLYYTTTRENRMLMQFDTSSIPSGSTVQSAILRMYVSGVGSPTTNTKSIWINAINESWAEGSSSGSSKNCPTTPTVGTSWNYRTNCTSWSYIHPPNYAPSWTAMANLPTARTNHMVATVNNKIYVIGGYHPSFGTFNTVEEYDPATNTWATKAPMPTNRSDAGIAVVNNKIYVMGGTSNFSTSIAVNEMYDPATNTWTTKAPMLSARMFLAAGAVNNKIYAIGGAKTSTAVKNNEEYDPATNTWTTKTQMPTAREYLAVQAANNKIYAIGGLTGTSTAMSNNEEYDPITNTWATKAALPIASYAMGYGIFNGNIYLIGGVEGGSPSKTMLQYDVLNNLYTTKTNYPISISWPVSASVNGYIYSIGGDDNIATVYQNHYRYDPGMPVPVATAYDEATTTSPLAAGFTSGWVDFDIKALVQEWVDGVRVNNGVVIYTNVADQFSVNSRENSANKPQLIIKY